MSIKKPKRNYDLACFLNVLGTCWKRNDDRVGTN